MYHRLAEPEEEWGADCLLPTTPPHPPPTARFLLPRADAIPVLFISVTELDL